MRTTITIAVPALVAVLLSLAAPVLAQSYPNKPIRFMVDFVPGGANDIVARALALKLAENMGQSVVVENRGGANTAIATELASRAAPDGYTILLNAPGHATNPALMKLPFDPIKDFAFITQVAEAQNMVVVHPSFPQGADPVASTPEQYAAFMQSEILKWGKVIQAAGIKGE